MKNFTVTNYQGILGLILLIFAGYLGWSQLGGLTSEERPVRAKAEALDLAHAVLDYRSDSGQWPRNSVGGIDLSLLVKTRSPHSATTLAAHGGGFSGVESLESSNEPENSWLREIPLDPWGHPYQVLVENGSIVVLSSGPDGKFDTDHDGMRDRTGDINPCDGDDVGLILALGPDGEIR